MVYLEKGPDPFTAALESVDTKFDIGVDNDCGDSGVDPVLIYRFC